MENNILSKIDLKASDVITIWIWSILFGATASLSYRVAGIIENRVSLLSIIAVVAGIFILLSWHNLYLSLKEFLSRNNDTEGERSDVRIRENLIFSLKFIVFTVVCLFVLSLTKLGFTFFNF